MRGADGVEHSICRNGLCALLFVGKIMWQTAAEDPAARTHGLKCKTGGDSSRGKEMKGINESLKLFFTELLEEGLPFATRIIRNETGTTTQDDNPDDVMLPLTLKREDVTKSGVTSYNSTAKDNIERPVEPVDGDGILLWPPGSESGKVVSWPKFLKYWKTEFPSY